MKIIRKFSLLMVLILGLSLFSGCSKDELAFYDALMKNQEILSLESTTNMSFALSGSGLSEEKQIEFDSIANLVNHLTLTVNQKAQANEKLTKTKGLINATVHLPDTSFNSSVWVDMDFDSDKPVLKEIIQIPSIASSFLPEAYRGKEYMVLDFDTMGNAYEELGVSMDFNKILEIAMNYQDKFMIAFKEYLKDFDPQISAVSKLEDKVINGEKHQIYQVKLDDSDFKQFLQYFIVDLLKDEEIIPLFMEYMKEIIATTGEPIPEEMDSAVLSEKIPELILKVNDFFKAIKDLKIIGDKGIVIEYALNKDGFIVQETGTLDFVVDVSQYMNIFSQLTMATAEEIPAVEIPTEETPAEEALPVEELPSFNFEISYDSTISNINKDMEISIPEVNAENSVDYMEFMMAMVESITPSPELLSPSALIFVDDIYLETTGEVEFVNNRIFIPARDVSTALGADVQWNQSTKEVTISKGDLSLILKIGSKVALLNGTEIALDSEVYLSEGVTMVPVRFLSENLGYSVNWNSELRFVEILSQIE